MSPAQVVLPKPSTVAALPAARCPLCSHWAHHLWILWDRKQLPVHAQLMACLHGPLPCVYSTSTQAVTEDGWVCPSSMRFFLRWCVVLLKIAWLASHGWWKHFMHTKISLLLLVLMDCQSWFEGLVCIYFKLHKPLLLSIKAFWFELLRMVIVAQSKWNPHLWFIYIDAVLSKALQPVYALPVFLHMYDAYALCTVHLILSSLIPSCDAGSFAQDFPCCIEENRSIISGFNSVNVWRWHSIGSSGIPPIGIM